MKHIKKFAGLFLVLLLVLTCACSFRTDLELTPYDDDKNLTPTPTQTVSVTPSPTATSTTGSTAIPTTTPTSTPNQSKPLVTPSANTSSSTIKTNYIKPGENYSFWSYQFKSQNPYYGNTERDQQMNKRVRDLERKYDINITFYVSPSVTAAEMLRQAAYQGMPVVTAMKDNGLYSMMDTYLYNNNPGACIVPLSDHEDVFNFRDDAKFNVFSQYDLCEYGKKLWFFIPDEIGIDFEVSGSSLLFNKMIVKAAGYSAEEIYTCVDEGTWNWEKFEKVLKACANITGRPAIERGNSGLFMMALANSNNTDFIECSELSGGQKKESFVSTYEQSTRLMQAYDEFLRLANDLKVMETYYYEAGSTEPAEHFINGQVAWYYTGYSSNCFYKQIETMVEDYGIVPWPKGPSVSVDESYNSMYLHLNPYCVFKNNSPNANIKGAVQITCELFTPIYDTGSENAKALYQNEIAQYSRDNKSAKNLDMIESNKTFMRISMYTNAPCNFNGADKVGKALFHNGENDILSYKIDPALYLYRITDEINNVLERRSPYNYK